MDGIQNANIENFQSTFFGGEGTDVVGLDVEALEQGVGSGEAVRQIEPVFSLLGLLLLLRLHRVVHTLHEAQPVRVVTARIDCDRPQVDTESLTGKPLVNLVSPTEALSANSSSFVVQIA